ncbi:MAG: hypothetical protein WAK26_12260 [Terracidiphilus sp.]
MNSNLQLDLHPDADSLSAFAEQSLGAAEREQILTHMTQCSRCRQVIYLAQKAADAEDLETPSAMPSGRWYKSWRFAWVPAAVLAAALALVVTFHPWRNAQAPEIAKAAPPSAQYTPAPAPQTQASAGDIPGPALAVAATAPAENKKFPALSRPPQEFALGTAPSFAPGAGGQPSEERSAARTYTTESVQVRTRQQFQSQFNPQPAVDAWQQRQRMIGTLSASANTTQASQESIQPTVNRAEAGRSVPAFAAVSHTTKQAAPVASFDNGTQEAIAGSAASRNANQPTLPGGLAAISTATVRERTLAIDSAGALFLSEDGGKQWEPVAQQWTGRVVALRIQASAGGAVFQLTNAAGFSWTSADGKTWTVQ